MCQHLEIELASFRFHRWYEMIQIASISISSVFFRWKKHSPARAACWGRIRLIRSARQRRQRWESAFNIRIWISLQQFGEISSLVELCTRFLRFQLVMNFIDARCGNILLLIDKTPRKGLKSLIEEMAAIPRWMQERVRRAGGWRILKLLLTICWVSVWNDGQNLDS